MIPHKLPKGHFALLMTTVRKNNSGSQDSTVAALYHLNVSREMEKFIYKEQETAVKERFVIERTVRINTAIWIYEWSVYHTNSLHSRGDIQAHVTFARCI